MDLEALQQLLITAEEYQQKGNVAQAADVYETLLRQTQRGATETAVRQIRMTALAAQTRLLILLEKYHEGMDLCELYLAEANQYQDRLTALPHLSSHATRAGYYQQAITVCNTALKLAREKDDDSGRARALGLLASAYAVVGRLEEAIASFQESIKLFEKTCDLSGQANTWNRLGLAYQQRGMLDKAIRCHKYHLKLVQEMVHDDATVQILAFNNLGENYLLLYHLDKAVDCFQKGLALQESTRRIDVVADLHRNQGMAFCYQYQVQRGLEQLHRAWQLAQQSGNFVVQLQVLYSLTLAELQANNLDQAYHFGDQLRSLVEENGIPVHKSRALHALGLYYRQRGDLDKAKQMWEEALFLAHENRQRFLRWQLHGELALIAATPGLQDVHLRIAREIIEQIVEPIKSEELRQSFLNAPPVQAILS